MVQDKEHKLFITVIYTIMSRGTTDNNKYYTGISCLYNKYDESTTILGEKHKNNLQHNIKEIINFLDLNVSESKLTIKNLIY